MPYITDIVATNGSIQRTQWEFRGMQYQIIATHTGTQPSPFYAIDTIQRSDGMIITMPRHILRAYFAGAKISPTDLKRIITLKSPNRPIQ
ncbi:MAG: hypothetical protein Q4F57_02420 [Weeksellaceae bacterium]|nr:hypothetical protein [Weeksellaceae bacterium]